MFDSFLKKFLGTKHQREIKKLQPKVDAIAGLESKMKGLSDEALRRRTVQFRQELDNGRPLDELLIPAFATVREAGRRVLEMRHYDVQMIGGMVLHDGKIAEMKTGEGKTLVSTLPCYLNGLTGKGVHVVTVNDYLAKRDAEWMGKIHRFLGLTVGVIEPRQNNAAKKRAYRCDITYGQNNEFGFDYLRDNMKFSIYDYAQRRLNYAIIDEVDSILIDEARTPLIISGPGTTASDQYVRINEIVPKLRKDEHFNVDEKAHSVTLTEEGIVRVQGLLRKAGVIKLDNLYDTRNLETLHILQQSLKAHHLFKRDQRYMVSEDGQVLIIDEFTGRVLPGRRWSDGLHQAVEAKEHVPIQDENITLATISFQNLFRIYDKLSGMTGTADTEAGEFHSIYKLDVVVIPTNKPIARIDDEDVVYKSEKAKFFALADEIERVNAAGQPVLVGTTSVEKSDALSALLTRKNIQHNVLNAKQHEREAYVVAQAGTRGAVTVATNMAGRGTDIVLGGNPEMLAKFEVMANADEELMADPAALKAAIEAKEAELEVSCKAEGKRIKEAGGLAILGTERHESRRIDNQLRGRAGRQGDPGASRFFLSLEDDLMRIFAGERVQTMMDRLGMEEDIPIEHKWVSKAVENAQQKVEERNFDIRKNMLEYDDVLNQQRKTLFALRRQVLVGEYRTIPSDDEVEKGIEPQPMINKEDPAMREASKEILTQMFQVHAAPLVPPGTPPEEIAAMREAAFSTPVSKLENIRTERLGRDMYTWFGCQVEDFDKLADKPQEAYDKALTKAAMSLTEQKERMLDLVDGLINTVVERACPPNKHAEDWDLDGLMDAYEDQFAIEPTGILGEGDPQRIAQKLYKDAENILKKKEKEFGSLQFVRLFRNFYLQEIDRLWIDHLQNMDSLRDGIGLRGYGQRDPKREYKREGYVLFEQMTESLKASVAQKLFTVKKVSEAELKALEEARRKKAEERQRQAQAQAQAQAAESPEQAQRQVPQARTQGGRKLLPGEPRTAGHAGSAQPQQGQQAQPRREGEPERALNRRERRRQAKLQRKRK